MSGGHFDYQQFRLEEIADQIDRLIAGNSKTPEEEQGYRYEYSESTIERFKETAHTLRRAMEMVNRVDWFVSGDDGEENFHRRWAKEVRPPFSSPAG